jgi:hypothetical protein
MNDGIFRLTGIQVTLDNRNVWYDGLLAREV